MNTLLCVLKTPINNNEHLLVIGNLFYDFFYDDLANETCLIFIQTPPHLNLRFIKSSIQNAHYSQKFYDYKHFLESSAQFENGLLCGAFNPKTFRKFATENLLNGYFNPDPSNQYDNLAWLNKLN